MHDAKLNCELLSQIVHAILMPFLLFQSTSQSIWLNSKQCTLLGLDSSICFALLCLACSPQLIFFLRCYVCRDLIPMTR